MLKHKFRLCQFKIYPPADRYQDLQISAASLDSSLVHCNNALVGVNWATGNNGSLYVFPHSAKGRTKSAPHLLNAHSSLITSFAFSRFPVEGSAPSSLLVTGADDATVKIWNIPDAGLKEPMKTEVGSLSGHNRRITGVYHHPQAANIVATASNDKTLKVWDYTAGSCDDSLITLDHNDQVWSASWSPDGKLLVTTSKDKQVRIWDCRQSDPLVSSIEGEPGMKPSRVVWAKDCIVYSAFSKYRERVISVFNPTLDKKIHRSTLDSLTGILHLEYDADTDLVFAGGKGDASIKSKLLLPETSQVMLDVATFTSDVPQKGFCLAPKTTVDVMQCEVARLLKVHNRGIDPIKVEAPRKSKRDFHDDLFPPTLADVSVLEAAAWFGGENKMQEKISLKPVVVDDDGAGAGAALSPISISSSSLSPSSSSSSPSGSFLLSPTSPTGAAQTTTNRARRASSAVMTPPEPQGHWEEHKVKDMSKLIRLSKFKNTFNKSWKKELGYHHMKVSGSEPLIVTNGTHFAIPWKGVDGRVAIVPISNVGRVTEENMSLTEVSSGNLSSMAFGYYDPRLLAVGSEDCRLSVLRLPSSDSDFIGKEFTRADGKLDTIGLFGHERRVGSVSWHPSIGGLLGSGANDGTIRVWDLQAPEESAFTFSISENEDERNERGFEYIEWHVDGSEIIAANRDCFGYLIDPRGDNEIIAKFKGHDTNKGFRAQYCGSTPMFFTCGFSKDSERQIQMFDRRKVCCGGEEVTPALSCVSVDHNNGVLLPYYDSSINCIFLAGRGSSTIRLFESSDSDAPYMHYLEDIKGNQPISAICWMPKTLMDVPAVEVNRALYLYSKEDAGVQSFYVPRTRKEFFQDDVFVPIANPNEPQGSPEEWFNRADFKPSLMSLKPDEMDNLSDHPEEKKTTIRRFVEDKPASPAGAATGGASAMFAVVNSHIQGQMDDIMKWEDPTKEMDGVSEDEWGDDDSDDGF